MRQEFRGVLLKPLDQQHDRDDTLIDPAGVQFDPEQWFPIWKDFDYRVPEGWLGRGRVSRETDGSLWVEGELEEAIIDPKTQEQPWKLAIGVLADKMGRRRKGVETLGVSRLVSISLTTRHADLEQPPIVIGINRRDSDRRSQDPRP